MIRIFQISMLAIALGYWLHMFWIADLTSFGAQFRYLTIWALTGAVVSWSMCLLRPGRAPGFHAAAAVLSALVVLLYWRLYFADPANVNGDSPIRWYLEYYLHLAGPVLQGVNAVVLIRVFDRPVAAIPWMAAVFVAYVAWIELLVQPFNDVPVGSITTGLPYPFLNNMELGARAVFYGTTAMTLLVLLAVGAGLGWLIARLTTGSNGRRAV